MTRSLLLALALSVLPLQAQLQFSFGPNQTSQTVTNRGATLEFQALAPGQASTGVVTVLNSGITTVSITQINVSGSSFALGTTPSLPISLAPGQRLVIPLTFSAANSSAATGQLNISYTAAGIADTASFLLRGTSPELVFTLDSPNNTNAPVQPGSRIVFPNTAVGGSSTATLNIANRGSAPAAFTSVVVTGADFSTPQIQGSIVPAGSLIAVPIRFSPSQRGASAGNARITSPATVIDFPLAGTGAAVDLAVSYTAPPDNNTFPLAPGGALQFPNTGVNQTSTVSVSVTNRGDLDTTVNSISIAGRSFQLASLPLLPATLASGRELRFSVRYSPTELGASVGTLNIAFSDRTYSVALNGATAAPKFVFNYGQTDLNNAVPVVNGQRIVFPTTRVGAVATLVLSILNTGEGSGFVNNVRLIGSDEIQVTNVPVLPAEVPSGRDLRLNLRYAPKTLDTVITNLQVDANGSTVSFVLQGASTNSTLTYQSVNGDSATTLTTGSKTTLPDTAVGEKSITQIRITNSGNADATITSLSLTGAGFTLPDPPILPIVIAPNGTRQFPLQFLPTQAGDVSGRLRIADQDFELLGRGIGPQLRFSYSSGGETINLSENGTVLFTPTQVGQTVAVTLNLQNTGTAPTPLVTIGVVRGSEVFAVKPLPALPATLAPGATLPLRVEFTPLDTGAAVGLLQVNGVQINLSGQGTTPPALSSYQFSGAASGRQEPASQPVVGLRLTSPYPQAVEGLLTLSVNSQGFSDDPAVQFSTGGRVVPFTIRANSLDAEFPGGSKQIALQTGTVAASLTLTPVFQLSGGFRLKPADSENRTFDITRQAPRILSAQIADASAGGFNLIVTLYSTTRNVQKLDLTFAPKPGTTLTGSRYTVNTEVSANLWYRSLASAAFGGFVSITVPVSLQVAPNTTFNSLLNSVTVVAGNESGDSSPVTTVIP